MFCHRVKMMHCSGELTSASHLLDIPEMVWSRIRVMMTVTGLDCTQAQVDEVNLWNPVFRNRQDGLQTRLLLVGLKRMPYREQIAQSLHAWMRRNILIEKVQLSPRGIPCPPAPPPPANTMQLREVHVKDSQLRDPVCCEDREAVSLRIRHCSSSS
ncbi:Uncharacterized protein Rs2_45870 [Raphanus sativus]|nr:Uncharacterized protein Rs2_45870 [Raphanus sativus]